MKLRMILGVSMTAAVFGAAATAQNAPAGDPAAKPGTRHELNITSDSAQFTASCAVHPAESAIP